MDQGDVHSKEGLLRKTKASAYWERKKIKEVIDEALGLYLRGKRQRPRQPTDD